MAQRKDDTQPWTTYCAECPADKRCSLCPPEHTKFKREMALARERWQAKQETK